MEPSGRPKQASRYALLRRPSALLIAAVMLFGAPLHAQAADFSPQIWVSPGIYSWHFDRGKDLRDENFGLGVEVTLAEDHVIMGGSFINSRRARSHYTGYLWRPLHWQRGELKVGAGVTIAAFDGYPNYRNGGWFLTPLPVLSVEWKHLGANFSVVPTLRNRVDGAFSIQVKLRVW